ncbi:GNAT family N-acetyltransferase [Gynuella sunshinyii]|uniref:GNAT family N-acetyltransferase n=1 Tax=Gynuella sunshinyii TaxID=1445505 RepID=UPI0005CB9642|nr:GNAT family N-acetyltransferase [Gynuella sunshinyii]
MNLIVTQNPDQDLVDGIRAGLQVHNRPFLENVVRTHLSVHGKFEDGSVACGIVGEVWGAWLSIKYLFVSPSRKQQGIGSELLSKLEERAVSLGAKQAVLETYSFQAKGFYEKNGYELRMTLDNCPETEQLHYMTKVLGQSS